MKKTNKNHYLYWILRRQYWNDKNKSNLEKLFFANWKMLNNTGSSYFAGHHVNWNPCILTLIKFLLPRNHSKVRSWFWLCVSFSENDTVQREDCLYLTVREFLCYTRKTKHARALNVYSPMSCANEELSFVNCFYYILLMTKNDSTLSIYCSPEFFSNVILIGFYKLFGVTFMVFL